MLYLEIFFKLIVKCDSCKHLLVGKLSSFKDILQVTKFSQNWYSSMLFQGRKCFIHLVHVEEYFFMSPKMLPQVCPIIYLEFGCQIVQLVLMIL
jgi:hypothetical protein